MSTLRAIAHCRSVLAAVPVRPTTQQWRPFSHGRFLTAQTLNLSEKETAELNVAAPLPCPDPTPDSPSATIITNNSPYMVATYSRPTPIFTKGVGTHIFDLENRRYIDFTAGIAVTALGHSDPEFLRILNDQAKTLIHCSNLYHNHWTGELSRSLVEKTRESAGMYDVASAFICNSGSEANEAALKFARKVGRVASGREDKIEVLSFYNSFHGRTMGSLSATPSPKYQAPFAPLVPGFHYAHLNSPAAIEMITPKTCAVIIEPIQGEGGIHCANPTFLTELRKKCDEVGAVLIYDEIQCGMGRTGKLWAHSELPPEAHPHVLTTAKALGNGFPIGATIVNKSVAEKIVIGDHGTTFGGNPLASRLGHYVLGRLSDPVLLAHVTGISALFHQSLTKLCKRFPKALGEIRGQGLILGVQLDRDPAGLVKAARERGLLVITAGTNTLRLIPPLVIQRDVAEEGLGILERAMEVWLAERPN